MTFASTLAKTSLATVAAATVGTIATDPSTRWYKSQDKPEIQPPGPVFPIAWTAFYISIAGGSALALHSAKKKARTASEAAQTKTLLTPKEATKLQKKADKLEKKSGSFKAALAINLVLNAGWSVLFWQGRDLKLASIEAGVLAISSVDLARRAGALNPAAGAILVPYSLWCCFATLLSTRFHQENN